MDPERRREHLLDVASDYVAVHGTQISLDDIAREAGISPPLMRHYFTNRDGLVTALTERATGELEDIFLGASGGDLGERLAHYLTWVADHQWAHWLWVAAPGRDAVPDFAPTRRKLAAAAVGTPWEAQDLRTRVRANAWVAATESTVTTWLEAGRPDLDETVGAMLDVAKRLDVVCAKPAARAWARRVASPR
jgi:AcrR family transcriptional regulator